MDLRSYQITAVDKVLSSQGRCVVKMFCGTGKSRVMATVALREKKHMNVIVFPSLALVQQFSTDYVQGAYADQFAAFSFLNVSSEQLVGVQSTTDTEQIHTFCSDPGNNPNRSSSQPLPETPTG